MSNRTLRSASVPKTVWVVIFGSLLLLGVVPRIPPGAAGAPPTPQDGKLLDQVRGAWRGIPSLTARFEQTQQFAGFDEPLRSTGVLRVLRPNYFDLRFDPPHRQRQVCDGAWVWTYMEEQKQVFKAPLGRDATRGADLLDWATEGAVVASVLPDSTFSPDALRLEMTPGPNLPLLKLRLWVRKGGLTILGYEAVDAEGNRTRMRITELRKDKGLKPDQFRFTPPAGVEVIEVGSPR